MVWLFVVGGVVGAVAAVRRRPRRVSTTVTVEPGVVLPSRLRDPETGEVL